jgi:hypothetical protein
MTCFGVVGCLSELVQALWFEDVSFLNEQMLDTPVGRFSIRQMAIFLIFGLLAWISSLAFTDLVLKIVVAGAVFFSGAALFTRKIKTIPPEIHLLHLIRQFLQTTKQKHTTLTKSRQSVEQTSKVMHLLATIGTPTKIVGILKDKTGKTLVDKTFQVTINNTPHSKGTTDPEGNFCTYFIPDQPGLFQIDIQPQDHPDTIQKITIQANPQKTEQKEEEGNQNAQKTIA